MGIALVLLTGVMEPYHRAEQLWIEVQIDV
jgi:hypothetical protein